MEQKKEKEIDTKYNEGSTNGTLFNELERHGARGTRNLPHG